MKKAIMIIPLVLFALLVLALVAALRHSGNDTSKFALHVDEAVPVTDILLVNTPDVHFKTADWHGRPYMVNFFASWCVECQAEHEQLIKLALDNIPMIGIDFKDKPESVNAYLAKQGNPFIAIASDAAGRTGIDWGITGVPETFLIDANGKILFHHAGVLTEKIIAERLLPLWQSVKK